VTSMRTASILSNIGFRTKGGVRSTLNKIARLGKISKGASLRKNWNKGIGYKSIV